ncbi:MAG: DUF4105 domain-containing protein [Prevotellaceae bacterium]|jgi:hypothetical protein|nr:DUF4105 domain-containing protein [Prevotellaceae bacterium]
MKRFLLAHLIFIVTLSSNSQTIKVTDSTQISLITCSPSRSAVYAQFGHSGMRIYDAMQKIDWMFNWGVFSFNTSNFYLKFISGYTDYQLGVVETPYFLEDYHRRGSSVTEQVLDLNLTEKNNLIYLLMQNYQPENRVYRYNFVFDNCATRPGDLIMTAINSYHEHICFNDAKYTPLSYRELIAQYVGKHTWLMFGIDLVFGAESDEAPDEDTAMFLPEIMKERFAHSTIVSNVLPERSLILSQNILVPKSGEDFNVNARKMSVPFLFFLVLFIARAFLLVKEIKVLRKKYLNLDSVLLISVGVIGIIAFFLTFISIHPMVGCNYNLLWLMPLNVIAGILIWYKPMRKFLFFYFVFYATLIIVAWIIYAAGIQSINYAFIPLILTMMLVATSWIIRCSRTVPLKRLRRISKHSKP